MKNKESTKNLLSYVLNVKNTPKNNHNLFPATEK